ncbi:DUF4254 domain-containing protein [Ferruginibacter paludis]|uniref:DUF4254 domain-containing protein n=1 Tax=Ferruginibacter paludis TaxID=1310417 RepID=UPI0025B329B5|nr:DUF4254 domain-containing protein [Ferruginibacter paludis]MDN3654150.1 DUF4254 domain-containing protein [Ferruginibacter paludis]
MMISELCNTIFDRSINDYHVEDSVEMQVKNPYTAATLEHLLYTKNWIDTVQWHLEDIVRNPDIDPVDGLSLKRKIDASNQLRTDMVEYIDSYFLIQYKDIQPKKTATINTESPAWAIDRLSILGLKIYHMNVEVHRRDASAEHIIACTDKLAILMEQRKDLSAAIDALLADIAGGDKYMKVYKQMKMYNDPGLNPVLYQQQTK